MLKLEHHQPHTATADASSTPTSTSYTLHYPQLQQPQISMVIR